MAASFVLAGLGVPMSRKAHSLVNTSDETACGYPKMAEAFASAATKLNYCRVSEALPCHVYENMDLFKKEKPLGVLARAVEGKGLLLFGSSHVLAIRNVLVGALNVTEKLKRSRVLSMPNYDRTDGSGSGGPLQCGGDDGVSKVCDGATVTYHRWWLYHNRNDVCWLQVLFGSAKENTNLMSSVTTIIIESIQRLGRTPNSDEMTKATMM